MSPEATHYIHHAKYALMNSEFHWLMTVTILVLGLIYMVLIYQGNIKLPVNYHNLVHRILWCIFGALAIATFQVFRIVMKFFLIFIVLVVIVVSNQLDVRTIIDETYLLSLIWFSIAILEVTAPANFIKGCHCNQEQ
jgi:glucan phosphoethanolaminetransferase (alkaline phosphatase superfamily)